MNKERLLKLSELLEKDANNPRGVKFDLSNWGLVGDETKLLTCRTTACAMGLAAISGVFAKDGLSYRITTSGFIVVHINDSRNVGVDGFEAAEILFGIDYDTAAWLFDTPGYSSVATGARGERKVAKRIRDFVAGKATP